MIDARRFGILAGMLAFVPLAAQSAETALWDAFLNRCLTPYENYFEPVPNGLTEAPSPEGRAFLLPGGRLVLERAPEDGASACRVEGARGADLAAFDRWKTRQIHDGRYVPGGAGWQSNGWVEPVLEVQMMPGPPGVLRMLETELES